MQLARTDIDNGERDGGDDLPYIPVDLPIGIIS